MSANRTKGFDSVSAKTTRVEGVIAARSVSGRVASKSVCVIPNRASSPDECSVEYIPTCLLPCRARTTAEAINPLKTVRDTGTMRKPL